MLAILAALLPAAVGAAKKDRPEEPQVLVVTDQNRADAALLTERDFSVLRGALANEPIGSDAWKRRAIANALVTDYYRNRESAFYRSQDEAGRGYPCRCLALSGGGMRSLAFSTGVMSALHEIGVYQKTDVVSAVSGGAYANYWVLSHVRQGALEDEILSGAGSDQLTRLRSRANGLMTVPSKTGMLVGMMGNPGPTNSDEMLLDLGLDLFSRLSATVEMVPTPQNDSYGATIHRMVADQPSLGVTFRTFSKYQSLVESGSVPLPIWLTTAREATEPACVGTESRMEVTERARSPLWVAFETSPLRIGSDWMGFVEPRGLAVTTAVAASASGMNVPYTDRCRLLSGLDSSVLLRNYPQPVDPVKAASGQSGRRRVFADMLLIDGGLVDNLAVIPLVRRLCSEIIIVDAEFDPYLVFPAFGYLKQHLADQNISIEIPELEALARSNRREPDRQGEDPECIGKFCLVNPKPECVLLDDTAECVLPDRAPKAVFEGRIGPIPLASPATQSADGERWEYGERSLRVIYVKLALDGARIDEYPVSVRQRYLAQLDKRKIQTAMCTPTRVSDSCVFPHESTADLDFRDGQFEAYWDLGRCTIERYWQPAVDGSSIRCADSTWPAQAQTAQSAPP